MRIRGHFILLAVALCGFLLMDTPRIYGQALAAPPNHVEEFDNFQSMIDRREWTSSDVGPTFSRSAEYTADGFPLDGLISQNRRGLTFAGTEGVFIRHDEDLEGYEEDSHMIAFWFRMANIDGMANDRWTQLISVYNKGVTGATDVAYTISLGRANSGFATLKVTAPNATGSNVTSLSAILSGGTETWHRMVIQYQSASDDTNSPATSANLRYWINPANGSATPNFDWSVNSGVTMTSKFGAGPLGRYAFGRIRELATHYGVDGPSVYIDSIATWDGYGTAGENDLAAAIDFLAYAINRRPQITLNGSGITIVQGGHPSPGVIATISDDQLADLEVSVTGNLTGLTVVEESFDGVSGELTYVLAAACEAPIGTRKFTITATDPYGETRNSQFDVVVEPYDQPTIGTYEPVEVYVGGSASPEPSFPNSPASIDSVSISPETFPGGTASVELSGKVTLTTSVDTPPDTYEFTITATDFCGGNVQETLQLIVNGCNIDIVTPDPDPFPHTSTFSNRFDVDANGTTCSWKAVPSDDWIIIVSQVNSTGNGWVIYNVLANNGTEPRVGTITVSNAVFTIHQKAIPGFDGWTIH